MPKGKKVSAQDTGNKLKSGPHRRILIPFASDPRDPYGGHNVFVGINGYVHSIRRGQPVVVPEPVAEILSSRRRITMTMQRGEDGHERSTPVEVQDYPFQDLGPCNRDGSPLNSSSSDDIPPPSKPKRSRRVKAADAADTSETAAASGGLPELMRP